MEISRALSVLEPIARPSVADSVFDELHRQILRLDLPPGTKMSEAEVARALGVSRQPVRDAFYRLSKAGFLTIRPQRATTVSQISQAAVFRAQFIRTAIEIETARVACDRLTDADIDALGANLAAQAGAVKADDREGFYRLDDAFHRDICERAGAGFAWDLIREMKSHMDRVRFLTLSFALEHAFAEHGAILEALRARDPDRAAASVRLHLSRILKQIVRIRAENAPYFADEP